MLAFDVSETFFDLHATLVNGNDLRGSPLLHRQVAGQQPENNRGQTTILMLLSVSFWAGLDHSDRPLLADCCLLQRIAIGPIADADQRWK